MDANYTGRKIAALRKERGWTQKELAEHLHVTDKAVSKWERGINYPDISLWEPISALFGITLLELLGAEGESAENAAQKVAEISKEEKNKMRREFRTRSWLNIAGGMALFFALIKSGHLFYEYGPYYGLPQILTVGMTGMTAMIIGNAIYTLMHDKKLG